MKRTAVLVLIFCAVFGAGATRATLSSCTPFNDVPAGLCSFVLELYYLGITAGTSPTTFSPDQPVTRGQAAVFVSKAIGASIQRSSRRAALGQWWTTTPQYDSQLGVTTVGVQPLTIAADGSDIWVANGGDGTVSRVRASDGRALETWTGPTVPPVQSVLVAMGRVFVLGGGGFGGGTLYSIDPSGPAGAMTPVATTGNGSISMAFDGSRIWVSHTGALVPAEAGLAIVTPGPTLPWTVTQVTNSQHSLVGWPVFDGNNMWLANSAGELLRLDANGAVIQAVALSQVLNFPVFDGANIWVPSSLDSNVSVVRASSGTVIATLTGNGLNVPRTASFDGARIMVANFSGDSVSLWRAADFTPLGSFSTGASSAPLGVCSDGVNFWISLSGRNQLARF